MFYIFLQENIFHIVNSEKIEVDTDPAGSSIIYLHAASSATMEFDGSLRQWPERSYVLIYSRGLHAFALTANKQRFNLLAILSKGDPDVIYL